jgi:glycosyltransferase involved in cell wall biosynthesis
VLIANIFKKSPTFLEFQDPLMGSEMKRSKFNKMMVAKLEKVFISRSTKTIFVTKAAAKAALDRNPDLKGKISAIYPGAVKFPSEPIHSHHFSGDKIEFLHLGTLYDARNLDNFFKALDNLREQGVENAQKIIVKNLGDCYLGNIRDYIERVDFEILEPRSRIEAIKRASEAQALLLVQHSDSRSSETIPYKTYDYLNIGRPIFALINNPELNEMLTSKSHYVASDISTDSIQTTLVRFLADLDSLQKIHLGRDVGFHIEEQFDQIFRLYNAS